ncbi:MAG TPA: hypothetical protein VL173_16875 [Vicinamibacterales bacterium]|jgi:hypothetical protein|nr:hypothetical protein [Vicinamibacterales bacterium]
MKARPPVLAFVVVLVVVVATVPGQGRQGSPAPPRTARSAAPIDLTGYWVSVVTEDWRWRMLTPPKGDAQSVPINAEGKRVTEAWDLAKDNAAGLQCKAFGVGGIMRQPGRLHITWADDNTLKIEADAGTQTRLLNFDRAKHAPAEKTWQGFSVAQWVGPPRARGAGPAPTPFSPTVPGGGGSGLRGGPPPAAAISQGGSLEVTTTAFRDGYLRKNGVPYSQDATIVEYFDRLPPSPNGDVWLLVMTMVDDPKYLTQPFYTSTHFKLERDGSKWKPSACSTDAPAK